MGNSLQQESLSCCLLDRGLCPVAHEIAYSQYVEAAAAGIVTGSAAAVENDLELPSVLSCSPHSFCLPLSRRCSGLF